MRIINHCNLHIHKAIRPARRSCRWHNLKSQLTPLLILSTLLGCQLQKSSCQYFCQVSTIIIVHTSRLLPPPHFFPSAVPSSTHWSRIPAELSPHQLSTLYDPGPYPSSEEGSLSPASTNYFDFVPRRHPVSLPGNDGQRMHSHPPALDPSYELHHAILEMISSICRDRDLAST